MATVIEVHEDKMQNISEYAEKILRYGGKLMQSIEELENKSKYSEYYGRERKPHEKERWEDDDRHITRYY